MRQFLAFFITTIMITLVSVPNLLAAGDSLNILLKDNTVSRISIHDIRNITFSDLTAIEEIRKDVAVENYPNPFSETTKIEFTLKNQISVYINIYSQTGELIRHIECPDCIEGMNTYQWDCLNSSGIRVSEGVYFFEVINGTERLSKKLLLVR